MLRVPSLQLLIEAGLSNNKRLKSSENVCHLDNFDSKSKINNNLEGQEVQSSHSDLHSPAPFKLENNFASAS